MGARPDRPTSHLNLRWSLTDVDRFVGAYNRGITPRELGRQFNCSEDEIRAFIARNSAYLPPRGV